MTTCLNVGIVCEQSIQVTFPMVFKGIFYKKFVNCELDHIRLIYISVIVKKKLEIQLSFWQGGE